MNTLTLFYATGLFIAGLLIVVLIIAGSHGHFILQNKETSDALTIFAIFTIAAVLNLIKRQTNLGWLIVTLVANAIVIVISVKILMFIIDFNTNKGEFPILFPIVIIALGLASAAKIVQAAFSIVNSIRGRRV